MVTGTGDGGAHHWGGRQGTATSATDPPLLPASPHSRHCWMDREEARRGHRGGVAQGASASSRTPRPLPIRVEKTAVAMWHGAGEIRRTAELRRERGKSDVWKLIRRGNRRRGRRVPFHAAIDKIFGSVRGGVGWDDPDILDH
ncbi:unnamed protein product [Urochloa humidicola]